MIFSRSQSRVAGVTIVYRWTHLVACWMFVTGGLCVLVADGYAQGDATENDESHATEPAPKQKPPQWKRMLSGEDAKRVVTLVAKVSSLRKQGKFKQAAVYYRKALTLEPRKRQHYIQLAAVLRADGQHHLAETLLSDALQRFPEDRKIQQLLQK